MVFNYSLLQNGFPPLVIEKETKDEYSEFLGNQDLNGFYKFALELLEKEQKRLLAFQNQEQEQIKYE